jgi:hypothetical protein
MMSWKLFSINKKESLVDILSRYHINEIREAIRIAKPPYHLHENPPKRKEGKNGTDTEK